MDAARLDLDLNLSELRIAGARQIEPRVARYDRDGQIVPSL